MRRAALALGLAVAFASPSRSEIAAPAPPQAPPVRPHPQIPGTLDPTTGVFRPDTAPAGYERVTGQINMVFDLDAKNFSSVSIVCSATIAYFGIAADGSTSGTDILTADQIYPTFKNGKFIETLPADFDVYIPTNTSPRAHIVIECRYINNPSAEAFNSVFDIPLHSGSVDVGVGGVMNGMSFGD